MRSKVKTLRYLKISLQPWDTEKPLMNRGEMHIWLDAWLSQNKNGDWTLMSNPRFEDEDLAHLVNNDHTLNVKRLTSEFKKKSKDVIDKYIIKMINQPGEACA